MRANSEDLQRYRDYAPTGCDVRGLAGERLGRGDWFVGPCVLTRDDGTLPRSNWAAALRALGGESDTVEVHRFGHWGVGWFEIVLIDPADAAAVGLAVELRDALAEYPVVDEHHWSELQWTEAGDAWARMSTRDRVAVLQRADLPIWSARRDELPSDDNGRLLELLTD